MQIIKKIINQISLEFNKNKYYNDKEVINNLKVLNNNNDINIITIAFNNPTVIDYQSKLINKYIKDSFNYIVFDNSNDIEASKSIEEICKNNNVTYFKYDKKLSNVSPSESHALAINYAIKNYILKSNSRYLVLLDHDIFPLDNYSFKEKINNQDFYGLKQERKNYYYIWPGFCVLDLNKINKEKIDFMVSKLHKGDTGAKMYFNIYRKINIKNYSFAAFERKNIISGNDDQEAKYDLIDNSFLHMINAGKWKKTNRFEEKENKIYEILRKKL